MTDTLWNDIVYTEVMQSDGFVVDYAICTTYSLDMPTLLSVPFMLGTMVDLTEDTMRSPHFILETINRSADKFAVFCNAGCIAVPPANSKLYSLLERSVVQVTLPTKGHGYINFHPKLWVIKEINPETGEKQIKLVVLSRNLTCSHDLDVVCEMVGKIKTEPATEKAQKKHAPLADFLTWLIAEADGPTMEKNMRAICEDIRYIERFNLENSPFEDYNFFPMGISQHDETTECLEQNILKHAAEMLIISPFVDHNVLKKMVNCTPNAKKTLITRHSSIKPDMIQMFNDGIYTPKDILTDKEEKDVIVDLHEKVYFIHSQEGNQSYNRLYLGSTNATTNGFGRNVEFLLQLQFSPYTTSYDKFRSGLINDSDECMFEEVVAIPDDDTTKEDVPNERVLRTAIAAIQKAEIKPCNSLYSVTIHCCQSQLPKQSLSLYPLGCEGIESNLADGMVFTDLELSMLTEFYVIQTGDLRRVIKIPTIGMPEERDTAIFRSIINTKAKFINYLSFMLTDDIEQYIVETQLLETENNSDKDSTIEQQICTSLYEDMVRKAYTHPDRISAIRQLLDKAEENVRPENFKEMYETFEKVLKQIKRL
nr:phospholipase D family protein [uncultured Alloprevotella sp.]